MWQKRRANGESKFAHAGHARRAQTCGGSDSRSQAQRFRIYHFLASRVLLRLVHRRSVQTAVGVGGDAFCSEVELPLVRLHANTTQPAPRTRPMDCWDSKSTNVVGIVAAKLSAKAALSTSGELPEDVNYAVKSSFLLSFLESVPDGSAELKESNVKDVKFEDVVEQAKEAAVLVLVY